MCCLIQSDIYPRRITTPNCLLWCFPAVVSQLGFNMTGWIFRLLALFLCQILSYIFVIANLMYTMIITNFNMIQCCVQKVHDSAQFSDITFQWKIYSRGTVLLRCNLCSHSFVFSSCFFFCPPSSFRWDFPVFLPEVAFISRFGRKADSYSEIQFGAIFHLLVNNRTPHRSKPIIIRGPTTILRPKNC